ncbi:hypothetical protein HDU98_011741 [Podochytrium sp. JEL0797]|nr:hypothetical protein HDU98_011741 [Podochytrium sp. JEL0797]
MATLSPYGHFVLTQLPASVNAGEPLRCWVEMRIAAVKGLKAEDDLMLSLACLATCRTSVGVAVTEECWSIQRKLADYKQGGVPKVFEQGTHSYIVLVDVPADAFPSVPAASADQNGTQAHFSISYVLRCTFPSRDTPFTFEQSIEVTQSPLSVKYLSPLVMQDRSPLGISVSVRANREQWHADRPATLFYTFKAPFKSDVPTVLLEIRQRLNLPTVSYHGLSDEKPADAGHTVTYENVVATYPLPPVHANTVSNLTIHLAPVPYLAPSMFYGPIDVDYDIRVVAVFPPPAQGGNPIVEFLAVTPLNILPASQALEIEPDFDEIDSARPTDGSANEAPVIDVPPVLPNSRPHMQSLPRPQQQQSLPPPQFHPQQFNGPPPPGRFQGSAPTTPSRVFSGPPPPQQHQQQHLHGPVPPANRFSTSPLPPQGAIPSPPPHAPRHQPSFSDSLEARLKRAEAAQNAAPVDPNGNLPGYFPTEQQQRPTPPPPQGSLSPGGTHMSPLVSAFGAMFGGVAQPGTGPRKSADFGSPPRPISPSPASIASASKIPIPSQHNLHHTPQHAVTSPTAEQQRMKMQQDELDRIQQERAKLILEAETLRETERRRVQAEEETRRAAQEAVIAQERMKVEVAKREEMERVAREKKALEEEMMELERQERLRIDGERKAAEEAEKARVAEEAKRVEMERLKVEEAERARVEEEERKQAEEDEKRRVEDERIEAMRRRTEEARRQLELGKKQLLEEEQYHLLEQELEQMKRDKLLAAEKLAAQKQLEEIHRLAEVERLKKEAEIRAEKVQLEAELQFAKERAENEKLKEEIARLKALKSGGTAAPYAMGNVASGSSSQNKNVSMFQDDDDDPEPLMKSRNNNQQPAAATRQKSHFYKVVGAVREQTRRNAPAAPAVPHKPAAAAVASGPSDDNMQAAYHAALDSYRNRLFTHLSYTGIPINGREQAIARNDELISAGKVLSSSSRGSGLMDALEAEMRVIESEILEDYETQLYQQVREKILDSKAVLQATFDAGIIQSSKELNEQCKIALEGLKMPGDVSGRVYERAKADYETTVRQPLLKLVAAKERANAGGAGHGSSSGNSGGKCNRVGCSNPKANGKNFCSYNCELMSN